MCCSTAIWKTAKKIKKIWERWNHLKGNLICLLERSLIREKVDGTIRRLKGSSRWSHQHFVCEWRETEVNKHQSGPLERSRGALWKKRPLQIKRVSLVFSPHPPLLSLWAHQCHLFLLLFPQPGQLWHTLSCTETDKCHPLCGSKSGLEAAHCLCEVG